MEKQKIRKVGVIGVGNTLMGDDGVGDAVLKSLRNKDLPENVTLIDIGASGLNLLHVLAKLDVAIIVDATDFGGHPGETRCFMPGDLRSLKRTGLSTHECDLLNVIELSKELDELPETILIFAIQPSTMGPDMGLSLPLKSKLPEFAKEVRHMVVDMDKAVERPSAHQKAAKRVIS